MAIACILKVASLTLTLDLERVECLERENCEAQEVRRSIDGS